MSLRTAVLTAAALLATSTPAWAVPQRAFDCTLDNVVRPIYQQTVTGVIRRDGVPVDVTVLDYQGNALIQAHRPPLAPGYNGGYWLTNYGLDAYRLGDANGVRYLFLVDHRGVGPSFTIQVHELFLAGGWWQNQFSCTIR